jgi:hypothetical protein
MAYFRYNIFVTIAGISSYLAFSVFVPYYFAHAQSSSNVQCAKALSEAKEICTLQPVIAATFATPGAGIAETAQVQFSDNFQNEVKYAAAAKNCDEKIKYCESQCPQTSNPGIGFGDQNNGPSGTTSICRETLGGYYEAYLAQSEAYRAAKERFQAIIAAASASPPSAPTPTPTPTPTRSPTSDPDETKSPSQRFWGFGNF